MVIANYLTLPREHILESVVIMHKDRDIPAVEPSNIAWVGVLVGLNDYDVCFQRSAQLKLTS